MTQGVNKALDQVDMTYDQLVCIANDIIEEVTNDVNVLIQSAYNNVNNLTNDELRQYMLTLSLRAYSFCEIKEKSAFKASLAEILRKESHAKIFNTTDGTAGNRENTAIINTAEETLAEEIYTLVSALFKTKLDSIYRIVDTLKTVLMSRISEAKMSTIEA